MDEVQDNEARHILLSDIPALTALVPRHFTQLVGSSSNPLPPRDTFASTVAPPSRPVRGHGIGALDSNEILEEINTIRDWALEFCPGLLRADDDSLEHVMEQALVEHNIPREEVLQRGRRLLRIRQDLEMGEMLGLMPSGEVDEIFEGISFRISHPYPTVEDAEDDDD